MADRNGSLFRRRLRSAERFNESAMLRGLSRENTPGSKSSALLVSVTRRDQRLTVRLTTVLGFLLIFRRMGYAAVPLLNCVLAPFFEWKGELKC